LDVVDTYSAIETPKHQNSAIFEPFYETFVSPFLAGWALWTPRCHHHCSVSFPSSLFLYANNAQLRVAPASGVWQSVSMGMERNDKNNHFILSHFFVDVWASGTMGEQVTCSQPPILSTILPVLCIKCRALKNAR
jgi:hypothetical protein